MFGEFTVQIIERPGIATQRIFLFKRTGSGMEFVTHDANVKIVKEGEAITDDELYFADMSDDQLQAFAEALTRKGIKTHKDSVAEGKLAATERHLEDMRTIALHKYAPTTNQIREE